jgi:hypothetical protein
VSRSGVAFRKELQFGLEMKIPWSPKVEGAYIVMESTMGGTLLSKDLTRYPEFLGICGRMVLLVRAGPLLGWCLRSQNMTLLDTYSPLFYPFGKLVVSFNLRCHGSPR